MPKDIRKKEKQNQNIRKLDRNVAFSSRIKRSLVEQYERKKSETDNDKEKANNTNYAISKLSRLTKVGSIESAFMITGVSKQVYKNAKLKYTNRRIEPKNENKNIMQEIPKRNDVTNNSQKEIFENGKENAVKEYQNKSLIKEKFNYMNIKKHSYEENGIKVNNNSLKIKTRENMKLGNNADEVNSKIENASKNNFIKKSNIQKLKEKSTKAKDKIKKTGKSVEKGAKKVKESINGIGLLLGTGGGFVLLLVIIIVLIAGIFKSMFGIFFTNETKTSQTNNISIGQAVNRLENEVNDEIKNIKRRVDYDKVAEYRDDIDWKSIVTIYSVIASNRDKIDISSMNEKAYNKLKKIFNEVVTVDYKTSTYYVTHTYTNENGEKVQTREARTKLEIYVESMNFDEMVGHFGFSDSERNQALELLKSEYDGMWKAIL